MKERRVIGGDPSYLQYLLNRDFMSWEIAQALYGNWGENIILIMEREIEV